MPYRLLRFALSKKYPEPRMFREPERLKDSYEVVIIGGGGHGLGAAYYLAKDYGITDVAVMEKGYIGGGNTGRNTAIVRSNYLTVEGVKFYDESVRLFENLKQPACQPGFAGATPTCARARGPHCQRAVTAVVWCAARPVTRA